MSVVLMASASFPLVLQMVCGLLSVVQSWISMQFVYLKLFTGQSARLPSTQPVITHFEPNIQVLLLRDMSALMSWIFGKVASPPPMYIITFNQSILRIDRLMPTAMSFSIHFFHDHLSTWACSPHQSIRSTLVGSPKHPRTLNHIWSMGESIDSDDTLLADPPPSGLSTTQSALPSQTREILQLN